MFASSIRINIAQTLKYLTKACDEEPFAKEKHNEQAKVSGTDKTCGEQETSGWILALMTMKSLVPLEFAVPSPLGRAATSRWSYQSMSKAPVDGKSCHPWITPLRITQNRKRLVYCLLLSITCLHSRFTFLLFYPQDTLSYFLTSKIYVPTFWYRRFTFLPFYIQDLLSYFLTPKIYFPTFSHSRLTFLLFYTQDLLSYFFTFKIYMSTFLHPRFTFLLFHIQDWLSYFFTPKIYSPTFSHSRSTCLLFYIQDLLSYFFTSKIYFPTFWHPRFTFLLFYIQDLLSCFFTPKIYFPTCLHPRFTFLIFDIGDLLSILFWKSQLESISLETAGNDQSQSTFSYFLSG